MDTADQVGLNVLFTPAIIASLQATNIETRLILLFINYSICHLFHSQIVSVGTFRVLKLPLGFIRVLEWVS